MTSANNTPWRKDVGVKPHHGYRLHLIIQHESFLRLKNFTYFQKVAVDPLGGLCWPGGEDISPARIPYYAIKKRNT
jgi:hypothetical protein